MSTSSEESQRIELLARMIGDQRAGRLAPLIEYARLAVGDDTLVARTYLQLSGGGTRNASAAAGTAEAAEAEHRLGPYVLLRELGRGAQGTVWLARDERLERDVALKVARRPPGAAAPARLAREALVGARWSHPSLCPVLDVGADDGASWIAMRYVDGEGLAAWARRGQSWREVVALHATLARALHVAHSSGVVHRDVKSGNVLVAPDGTPVLVDFGVAALLDGDGAPLTLTGDAVGTPAYMAPEALATDGKALDARVDVWGLGVTLYESLTGVRPFEAPTREGLVQAIRAQEPARLRARLPAAPRDLEIVLATALAKEADARYSSAQDFADELERVLAHEPIRARAVGPLGRVARWARREPTLATALAALFLSLAAGFAVSGGLLRRTRAALHEKVALLSEVTRLADRDATAALLEEEPALWPAHPSRAEALERWLTRAADLLAREEPHRAARAAFSAQSGAEGAWLLGLLDRHLADLVELRDTAARVATRHARARDLARLTVDVYAAEWARAAREVLEDTRYDGLALAPQMGLVPLGMDGRSRMQEFAVHGSGSLPARDDDGALMLDGTSAIVLVLIPPGIARCGSDHPTPERPSGSPFVDPFGLYQEGPAHECRLDTFFIAKHELTQGQWEDHVGQNPSAHDLRRTLDGAQLVDEDTRRRLPVEMVSWHECTRVAHELGLELPTETQWEYSARAGSGTIWWCGDERESLAGCENLADLTAKRAIGPQGEGYEGFMDDGWIGTAPVGSFRANDWGLHDVAGNVWEWCRNTLEDWHHARPAPPEGRVPGSIQPNPAIRGGACTLSSFEARVTYRMPDKADARSMDGGVRLMRRMDP